MQQPQHQSQQSWPQQQAYSSQPPAQNFQTQPQNTGFNQPGQLNQHGFFPILDLETQLAILYRILLIVFVDGMLYIIQQFGIEHVHINTHR